ncbi:uncharacterized protein LOC144140095 [Haemaphysalis longicornis]
MATPPDVIMIQETHMEQTPKLQGYNVQAVPPSARSSTKGAAQGVCTFVRRGITLVELDKFLDCDTALELCATEVVIGRRKQESIFLVNAYSNPQHRNQRFRSLFQKTRKKIGSKLALVAGDFNSAHKELGYPRTTAKGRNLLEEAEAAEFELISDPQQPSRIGTSTARDTTPDLAFVYLPEARDVRWRNTGLNLGSDHQIIEMEIPLRVNAGEEPKRKHKITDWEAFRRQETPAVIDDIGKWTEGLASAVERVSTEIEIDESIPNMDSRLAHLMEARQSLQRRWKQRRHSRALRKKIAQLGREIERHSRKLCEQQWHAVCNEADGQLHAGKTWKLLRRLRDETASKSYQQHRLAQILHVAIKNHGEDEVKKRLNDQYLPEGEQARHPEYGGPDNPALDADIEEWEIRRAVQELNCRSAAGPDGIDNKTLRNLSDGAITALTGYYNECWRRDAMLLLQHDLLETPHKTDARAVLGLDLKSAFDNVKHSAILQQIEKLGLGKRSYEYIRAFLSGRTANLQIGHLTLDERKLGSVGTPQRAVISPFLFNAVMIPVAEILSQMQQIRHTIYADDITIWTTGGTVGHMEDSLQEAIATVEDCLRGTGLRCSPQKSELLILPPTGYWRKSVGGEAEKIVLRTTDGTEVPHVKGLRVLGMHLDSGGDNHTALERLLTKIGMATRLVKQVSTKHSSMREANLLRLLQSFVLSHVASSYKAALGLLQCTSNAALAKLGIHNSLEEIGEAQRAAQIARLGTTATGRMILQSVGASPTTTGEDREDLPAELARSLRVPPLPRNVHPERNEERRLARARALAEAHKEDQRAAYVDAAAYGGKPGRYAIVVVRASDGEMVAAGSVRAAMSEQAEEAAIALALRNCPEMTTILSDSRAAMAGYSRGRDFPMKKNIY